MRVYFDAQALRQKLQWCVFSVLSRLQVLSLSLSLSLSLGLSLSRSRSRSWRLSEVAALAIRVPTVDLRTPF